MGTPMLNSDLVVPGSIAQIYGYGANDIWRWVVHAQVLARILKMPVQNNHSKISAHPDLAYQIVKILILTTLIAYCVEKGNLHFSHALQDGLFRKYLVITPKKSKLKIPFRKFCLSKEKESV